MANAQKPTSRTHHMDICYNVLCKWVEQDLIILERIDTTINEANHFTKLLSCILFCRHIDLIMGHVPPDYLPAHRCSTGQFDRRTKLLPILFTTKDTMTCHIIPPDNNDVRPIST
jgi:hypothetical protein